MNCGSYVCIYIIIFIYIYIYIYTYVYSYLRTHLRHETKTCALRPAASYPPPYQYDKGVNTAGGQGGSRGGQGEEKGRTGWVCAGCLCWNRAQETSALHCEKYEHAPLGSHRAPRVVHRRRGTLVLWYGHSTMVMGTFAILLWSLLQIMWGSA